VLSRYVLYASKVLEYYQLPMVTSTSTFQARISRLLEASPARPPFFFFPFFSLFFIPTNLTQHREHGRPVASVSENFQAKRIGFAGPQTVMYDNNKMCGKDFLE